MRDVCKPPDGGGVRLLNILYSLLLREKLLSRILLMLLDGGPRKPIDGIGGNGSRRGIGDGIKSPRDPRRPISVRGGRPE